MTHSLRVLPFPALVGQESVKQALMMLATNPRLSGVLIRGEKGTAKSTAARGLARLLPEIDINAGCTFGCDADRVDTWCDACAAGRTHARERRRPPFETLPLGISEDQLLGTIDLEHALKHGERRFDPGLLARVNHGVLYVDEINLLEDHIVDLLLDSAAMGVNVVAREGVRVSHPAEFLLIGTMNPEEGDLRPQLMDRFGLCVDIRGIEEPSVRAEIVERSLAFEANPKAYIEQWRHEENAIGERIAHARSLLPQIKPRRELFEAVARLSLRLGVDGHRADILMVKSAMTLAALAGRGDVESGDVENAAELVYAHRLRRRPFEEADVGPSELRAAAREVMGEPAENEKKKPTRVA